MSEQFTAYEASQPTTDPDVLARIVETRPDLRPLVAANPATPQPVLDRLATFRDVAVDAALARRVAAEQDPFVPPVERGYAPPPSGGFAPAPGGYTAVPGGNAPGAGPYMAGDYRPGPGQTDPYGPTGQANPYGPAGAYGSPVPPDPYGTAAQADAYG